MCSVLSATEAGKHILSAKKEVLLAFKAMIEKEVERIKWVNYVENLMTRINFFPEMKVDGTFKNVKGQYSKKSYDFMKNILEREVGEFPAA